MVSPSVIGWPWRLGEPRGPGSARVAETWNAEFSVGAGPLGGGYSYGRTTTDLDLIDVNGDRFPDSVTREGALLNTGRGFSSQMILPNAKGQVFATEKALSSEQAFNEIFVGAPTRAGRGDYVVEFTPRLGVVFSPGKPGELIHRGTVGRRVDVLYAGPNPYTK